MAMTVLGIVLSLVPPALWFAWSETVLLVVAAIGMVSAAMLIVVADLTGSDENRRPPDDLAGRRSLSEHAVAEIHRISPLTYHHSLIEKARFRRAMDKVRQLIK
jgi:hypothetical protein